MMLLLVAIIVAKMTRYAIVYIDMLIKDVQHVTRKQARY